MSSLNRKISDWVNRTREWIVRGLINLRDWLKKPAVTNWVLPLVLTAVGVLIGTLSLNARRWWVIILSAIALFAFFSTILNLERTLVGVRTIMLFLWNHLGFLLIIAGTSLGSVLAALLIPTLFRPPDVPQRQLVAEVLNLLSKTDTEKWTAVKEKGEMAKKVLIIRNYEVMVIEDPADSVKKIYIKDGKKIAEDEHGPAPYSYSRKYYDGECNFAVDYLDSSLSCVSTEFRRDCQSAFQRYDCTSKILFPPPVPPVTYH